MSGGGASIGNLQPIDPGGRTFVRPSFPGRINQSYQMRKFIKWQVYPLPGGGFAVSNLKTILKVKSEAVALKVAKSKNRHHRGYL